MSEENENIQVFIRCRGRNSKETKSKSAVVVHVKDEEGEEVVLNPSNDTGVSAQLNSKRYTFDKVFGPMADQKVIFERAAKPLFNDFMKGYNCTILVYGMTSTGKTYTMSGEDQLVNGELSEQAGIIPRILKKLFEILQDSPSGDDYIVKCSFTELYNEDLKDLLSNDPNKKLRIYDQKSADALSNMKRTSTNIHIQNLHEEVLQNAKHGFKTLQKGLNVRQVAATKMNDVSSRSHAIFTLSLYKKNNESGDLFRISKMNLVDLAGSENISRSGALNQRAKEAGSINQSLLTLGRVISLLVENQQHIPYRESKLTRLLQDSLGGQTKTCMIATISPAKINYDETLSTLEYANKAKSIQNKPQLGSTLSKDILVKELSVELSKLKKDFNATKLRDGIYMDKDNYDDFMNDIQEYKTEISEMKRSSEILKKQNEKLQKQLYDSESQNNEYLTLINTLKSTVESLHNKIDMQRMNEQNLMLSSSKFKEIINCINLNLATFKSFEKDTKNEVNKILKTNLQSVKDAISSAVSRHLETSGIDPNIQSIHKEVDDIVVKLETVSHEVRDNINESTSNRFPLLLKKFDSNFNALRHTIQNFESNLNDEFSKLSQENNDLRIALKDSLFNNHESYLESTISRTQQQIELNSNELLNKFVEIMRSHNDNQKQHMINSLRTASRKIINIEKSTLKPVQEHWESSTCEIINSCDFKNKEFFKSYNDQVGIICEHLNEFNQLSDDSKHTIDKEIGRISDISTNIKNQRKIDKDLKELKDKFNQIVNSKEVLVRTLEDSQQLISDAGSSLKSNIIDNNSINDIEVQNVDKLLTEFETEQKEIKRALLPTGKTPMRNNLELSYKRQSTNESLLRSPPKFKVSERLQDKENLSSGKRKLNDGDHKNNNKNPKINADTRIPLRRSKN